MDDQTFASAVLEEIKQKNLETVWGNESGHWSKETSLSIDPRDLKSLLYTEDWVYIVVNLIASKISNQRLLVMKKMIKNGKKLFEPAEGHPIQSRLDNPNPWQDPHSFIYVHVADLVGMGNGITWDNGKWMIPCPAENISLHFNETSSDLEKYVIDTTAEGPKNTLLEIKVQEMIHTKKPNPSNLYWGLSPFIPGRKTVLFNRYTAEYLNNYFLKGTQPNMKLEMDNEVNEKSALRLMRSFQQAHTGRRNQHRTMVLPKGVKASPVTTSLGDQQLQDYLNSNRETILALFSIPKHELGLQDTGSIGSLEAKVSMRNFWSATLKPMMRLVEGEFNKHFREVLGDEHVIQFDISDVEVLQEDQMAKAELADKLLSTHTINEARAMVFNSDGHEDGDFLREAEKLKVSQQAVGQRPDEEESPPEEEQKSLINTSTKDFIAKHHDWWVRYQKNLENTRVRDEDEIHNLSLRLFLSFVTDAEPLIGEFLKEEKAEYRKSPEQLRKEFEKLLLDIKEEWVVEFVSALEKTMEFGYTAAFDVPFSLPNTEAIEALKLRGADGRRAILATRGINSFAFISSSMVDDAMDIIELGVKERQPIVEVARRLQRKFTSSETVDYRARRIARTEVLTAYSVGQWAAIENASELIPGLKKKWLSAGDVRVRDAHTSAGVDGEVKDKDEKFSNGLMYPRDLNGPAEEVINCRCTVLIIPPGESL